MFFSILNTIKKYSILTYLISIKLKSTEVFSKNVKKNNIKETFSFYLLIGASKIFKNRNKESFCMFCINFRYQ